MIAIFFSLIVSGTSAAPLNFLGVDSVVADPRVRTALNVLDTPVRGYGLYPSQGFFHRGYYPQPVHGYFPQVGFYPPVSSVSAVRVPAHTVPVHHHFAASPFGFTFPHHFVPQLAPVALDVKGEVIDDIVDVAEEEEDDSSSGPLVTIAESNDVIPLPAIPVLTGREPSLAAPPIPSGIVQATQPKFVQVVFQNHKASPHLPQLVFNSKTSPFLTQIREESAGILTL